MFTNWSWVLFALLASSAILVLAACGTGSYVVQPCECMDGNGASQAPLYLVPPRSEVVMRGALLPTQSGFKGIRTRYFTAAPVAGAPDSVKLIADYGDLLILRGVVRKRCELKGNADGFIASLREDFIKFRTQLDEQSAVFAPAEFEAITERVALLVPSPLRETLFFAYNFGKDDQGRATIDLRPGMRVRIDAATFQPPRADVVVAPAVGYVATGQLTYTVGRGSLDPALGSSAAKPDPTQTFLFLDSFLRQRRAIGASAPIPSDALIFGAGADDLDSVATTYLRLLLPNVFFDSTKSGASSNDVHQYPALLGDTTWRALEGFAPSNATPSKGTNPQKQIAMRGRDLLVPEILITINGSPSYVPVGTTLGDALATASSMTPAEVAKRVVVRRAVGGKRRRIRFATTSAEILELPVLKGDEIEW